MGKGKVFSFKQFTRLRSYILKRLLSICRKQQVPNHLIFTVMSFSYEAKILVAWSEAIAGNGKIRDWLIANGYKELGLFAFALRNQDEARLWLMKNGYPHLMAVINGAEGNENAIKWLITNNFRPLAYVALSGDGYVSGERWLFDNGHKELARVAAKVRAVKEEIEEDNNDPHRISST